jgi:cell division protein ZapA
LPAGPGVTVQRESHHTMSTTEVEIFGSVYHVRGGDDDAYVQELADTVSRTMREIADQVATVDTAKIAILAALNLADELSRCRIESKSEGEVGKNEIRGAMGEKIRTKVEALTSQLDEALTPETAPPDR